MKIEKLHIKNFKSIADLEIVEPSPFTVFVGPNGAGKSNIFEALEFFASSKRINPYEVARIFGGEINFLKFNLIPKDPRTCIAQTSIKLCDAKNDANTRVWIENNNAYHYTSSQDYPTLNYTQFIERHSRLFIGNDRLERFLYKDNSRLSLAAGNLSLVLKRLFQNAPKREEIIEWLQLFIPEFENIEFETSEFSGEVQFRIFEKHSQKPFPKHLISDGTYNILALLTAVYQSDEPQFLCIEEPENELNPFVIRKLVDFFRQACKDKKHYIWLNTHSQTLVECLTPEEIIVVDKIGGETKIKQIKGMNLHGLDMAEVWLSGALGGGTPW